MRKPTSPTYKTTNWAAYNEALRRRGSLTIWFDPEVNWDAKPSGKKGSSQTFSDAAIQTCLTMKVLFGMVDADAPPVRARCRCVRRLSLQKAFCG